MSDADRERAREADGAAGPPGDENGAETDATIAQDQAAETGAPPIRLMVFELAGRRHALDLRHVRAVRPLTALARIPGAPISWAGLMNQRGTLVPVLDLRRHLRLPVSTAGLPPRAVVVEAAGMIVAVPVDALVELRTVTIDELSPLDPDAAEPQLLSAFTSDMVIVLDLDALASDPELALEAEDR